MQAKKDSKACPNCSSKNTRKHTKRKNNQQIVQIHFCKNCNKYFTNSTKRIANKTYPAKIILNAISIYNLGHTQQQTSKLISQKFKINIPQRTISEWINQYKEICTFNKIRDKSIRLYRPEEVIFSERLEHQQIYNFQYHKAKLEILFKDMKYNNQFHNTSQFYEPLKRYLEKIPTKQFPHHIFKDNKGNLIKKKNEFETLNFSSDLNSKIDNRAITAFSKNNSINNKSINNNATSASGQPGNNDSINKIDRAITALGQLTETHADLAAKRCPAAEVDKNNLMRINNKSIINNATSALGRLSKQRASQVRFEHLEIKYIKKQNRATRLAKLSLNLANSNKERHQAIQNFMLINDSTTIAVEVPIYLTNWDAGYYRCSKIKDFWHRAGRNQQGFIFPLNNYKTPITGHIDILQIRNGLIHILDYKPDAHKEQPIDQLTIYALVLSRKLNLPLYYFKCAWFDENNYYEFFPLHAVYSKN